MANPKIYYPKMVEFDYTTPEDVKRYFFDHISNGANSAVLFWIYSEEEFDYDDLTPLDKWLIENGCDRGEEIFIRFN